jgi:ATP-dependent DNA ligase
MNKDTLYPESMQIPPMLYCGKPTKTMIQQAFNSGDWIGQEKKDGALYCLEKTDSGYVYLFSRTKSRKTGELVEKSENFPHIKEWARFCLPKGTILVGEIYVPGGHSNTVTKLSGCLPEKAYQRQFNKKDSNYLGPVKYYVFDIIRFEGEDLQNKPTIDRLEKYLFSEKLEWSFNNSYIERAETFYNNFEEHLQKIFKEGGEGIVFKKKDCPYRAGKRSTSSQMFKWKQHLDSIDLICIDLEPPTKEYTGKEIETWPYWELQPTSERVKGQYYKFSLEHPNTCIPVTKPYYFNWKVSMVLGCYKDGKIVEVGKVASGLTDKIKGLMGLFPEDFINKVIQVSCMSVDPKESTLRHPVFESIREDKNPEECLWENIFK